MSGVCHGRIVARRVFGSNDRDSTISANCGPTRPRDRTQAISYGSRQGRPLRLIKPGATDAVNKTLLLALLAPSERAWRLLSMSS
jgi:hypothetical protein